MKKLEMLYEGKAKKVHKTDNDDLYIVDYKDDATAGNGAKKGQIKGKGAINNGFSAFMFRILESEGVPTHFVELLSDNESLVKKVSILPLEVIIRNIAAGSFSKRYGVKEGTMLSEPTCEFSYKNDELGDPLMNDYHAVAMGLASWEQVDVVRKYAFKVNEVMKDYFEKRGVTLVDFKLEFGLHKDEIILADEISPDTCRFWDSETGKKLDKDRFRRDLGGIEEAYEEIFKRMKG